ncbi:ORF2 [Canna yellow mottle associated virus]|uniref:ORF2 n=1 Tax=Canna yellow mottle associated virus TaxID=2560371 RepID=A0A193H3B3_9VIRU|nr:ORF2 [Canna yellow mottle associated virus]ANN87816.1 ORF2 [Canna yellow mottle associated virus]
MSLANSRASAAYQEALAATTQDWDTASGFTAKSDLPNIATISRQLNSALFLLVRLDTKLAALEDKLLRLEARVRNIEAAKAQIGTGASDWKEELERLTDKLSNLKIGDSQKLREIGGNLKVIKSPYEILQSIQ